MSPVFRDAPPDVTPLRAHVVPDVGALLRQAGTRPVHMAAMQDGAILEDTLAQTSCRAELLHVARTHMTRGLGLALRKADGSWLVMDPARAHVRACARRIAALQHDYIQAPIAKAVRKAGDKQMVFGVALDPYQFDSQGDWVPPAEVEATAHDWLENSRVIGLDHEGDADAVVMESWLWPYPSPDDYEKAMDNQDHTIWRQQYGDQQVHSGCWVVGARVDDPDIWRKVLDGELAAWSIGGVGVRTEMDPDVRMPHVEVIDL